MIRRLIIYPLIIFSAFSFYQYGRSIWYPVASKILGKKTVSEVIEKYEETTDINLLPLFEKANVEYPPKKLAFIVFKKEKVMEIWAANKSSNFKKITQYPIKAASGILGPKLKEGDNQVPEGLYRIIGFNPNSAFHLSLKINYPNQYDLKHARIEGRTQPGTNIFIHGNSVSVGCLAMGDNVIEYLFTLAYKVGKNNIQVIISPTNPSIEKLTPIKSSPLWVKDLYENIERQYFTITKNIK